jgi:hypothetical protein
VALVLSRAARVAALLGALTLAACATPEPLYTTATPPMVLTPAAAAGVHDLRGPYREALCRRLPAGGPACDDVLRRLPGERPSAAVSTPTPIAALASRYRVGFVPGFMAECASPIISPFSDVRADLAAAGFDARILRVGGRGSTVDNAAQLARYIAEPPDDPRPFILVGYSKGLIDVLELVVTRPAALGRVAAVLSVAGASNGSPFADQFNRAYRLWLSRLPMPACQRGTGQEIDDLRRDVRLEWWRRHGPAVTVPVFALVTAPRRERISPLMWAVYRTLARVEPRNDGNLVWYDQIPPGSRLLGYLDADHWTVATPFAKELPLGSALFHDAVPRTRVIEAALEVVDRSLAGPAR